LRLHRDPLRQVAERGRRDPAAEPPYGWRRLRSGRRLLGARLCAGRTAREGALIEHIYDAVGGRARVEEADRQRLAVARIAMQVKIVLEVTAHLP
jgi:hypothetical protein